MLANSEYNFGFNAQTGQYCDLVKNGIIDPTKVIRTALADAASVASLMTTTECVIADAPEKNSKMGKGGHPGAMGGDAGDMMEGMY